MLLMMGPACDSPGGGKQAIAPDVTHDIADTHDDDALFPQPDSTTTGTDAVAPGDTAPPADSASADTAPPADTQVDTAPDTTASVCAQGCLPATPQAGPTVTFTQRSASTVPPTLAGGATPSGSWRLSAVEFYPYGTFTDGFSVTITNEGGTRGRAEFNGDAMQLALHLDLRVHVDAFGSSGEDTATSDVAFGGCFSADDGLLSGSFDTCASGWPAGLSPPDTYGYALGTDLRMSIELEPEFLIALLPPDQQAGASLVIVDSLTLVATLQRP